MSTSFFKKAGNYTSRGILGGGALGDVGRVLDPGGAAIANTQRGKSLNAASALDPGGYLTGDPSPIPDPGAPPSPASIEPTGVKARDRIRRQVYRAQGRGSTIKVSPSAAPYTGQPGALLGS